MLAAGRAGMGRGGGGVKGAEKKKVVLGVSSG